MSNETNAVIALQKALEAKFGQNIIAMDLRGVTPIADFFVIVTGNSAPQLAALADTAEMTLKAEGLQLNHTEGLKSANWVLLDFGHVIVHIFDKESREYYNLERIWGDAKRLTH